MAGLSRMDCDARHIVQNFSMAVLGPDLGRLAAMTGQLGGGFFAQPC